MIPPDACRVNIQPARKACSISAESLLNLSGIHAQFRRFGCAISVAYAIESPNSGFRRLNRDHMVFPNAMALTKALYLATWELTKKMDAARSKLGAGLCRTGDYVSRQADPELTAERS